MTDELDDAFHRYAVAVTDDDRRAVIIEVSRMPAGLVMARCRRDVTSRAVGTRCRAAWAMAELGFPRRPFLAERERLLAALINGDPSGRVRAQAARSLGMLDSRVALSSLLRRAGDPSAKVREAVAAWAYAAAAIGESKRALVALKRLCRDFDPRVRAWAAFSMSTSLVPLDRLAVSLLGRLAEDAVPAVRHEAVRAMVCRSLPGAAGKLRTALARFGVPFELLNAVEEPFLRLSGLPPP